MTAQHGFQLIQELDIPEINTHARRFRHIKTGAELISMENDDENKCFGITFRTPPTDSTGVAHIIEHAVLAGSRKYQVKEPFVELIKGSLKTFVNAFTYPDKTVYPVASQNLQDFYNLVDVYLDAVFYPLLQKHTFAQEGWHYELDGPDQPLTVKGVVFNEMKGAYSDPDDLLSDSSRRSLFPDTTYGLDSGGDPRCIPDLSYEQFLAFHGATYHPSNARIWFYGDDPAEERLQLLDRWLQDFDHLQIDSQVELQQRFSQPQALTLPYAAGDEAKAYVTVNWMLDETTHDAETNLALGILGYSLIGTSAAPLRKALIDSGLGEDLAGFGMEGDLRQTAFSAGLKGIQAENAPQVEHLILDTLQKLAAEGIDKRTVEASLNTVEFRLRENNTGGFPRGLALMLRALTTWLYEADPFQLVAFEKPLTAIKARIAADEPYFESLIQRYFLQNPHRTTLVLQPDPELQARQTAAENQRLAQIKASLSPEQRQQIMADAEELRRRQQTPDSPAALATIPRLSLQDLDKESKNLPIAISQTLGSDILFHDLFTNGILYLDVGLNLRGLPQELLPYLPLFSRALLQMGTEYEDFVSLSQRIGSKTGGIHPRLFSSTRRIDGQPSTWLFLRGKAMLDQTPDLLSITKDILTAPKLDDQTRFRQIVLEEKAAQESSLAPGGHGVVNGRLGAHFHTAGWVSEQMGGISYLFFLRKLIDEVDNHWDAVRSRLQQVQQTLVNRQAMLWNVTLDEASWTQVQPQVHELISALPADAFQAASWQPTPLPAAEGLTFPAQVNYVGKAANLYELGYELDGSIHVISGYLRTSWLWERVRMQGGAYGGFCLFDNQSGVFSFLSYRDPNLIQTLQNYDGTTQFLRQLQLSDDELTKGIIGTIGNIDTYLLPDAKGYTSMLRHLLGITDAYRQTVREQVLSTTAADFRAFADVLEKVNQQGHVVVLGSEDAIVAANAELPQPLQITKVL